MDRPVNASPSSPFWNAAAPSEPGSTGPRAAASTRSAASGVEAGGNAVVVVRAETRHAHIRARARVPDDAQPAPVRWAAGRVSVRGAAKGHGVANDRVGSKPYFWAGGRWRSSQDPRPAPPRRGCRSIVAPVNVVQQ